MRGRLFLRRLLGDSRGAVLIEFAFVAPVLVLFMMGIGDLLYGIYVNAILLGSVQEAGRNSTIEANKTAAAQTILDDKVLAMVRKVAPAATVQSSVRLNYSSFSGVGKPEPHTDKTTPTTNQPDVRDANECFSDVNGNGIYDSDGGRSGAGGAGDIASYTITISYPRVFPVAGLLGWGTTGTATARTILKNQPYAAEVGSTPADICP